MFMQKIEDKPPLAVHSCHQQSVCTFAVSIVAEGPSFLHYQGFSDPCYFYNEEVYSSKEVFDAGLGIL